MNGRKFSLEQPFPLRADMELSLTENSSFALGKVSFYRLSISAEDKGVETALRHSFSAEGEDEALFSGCLRGEGRVYSFKCAPVARMFVDSPDSSYVP